MRSASTLSLAPHRRRSSESRVPQARDFLARAARRTLDREHPLTRKSLQANNRRRPGEVSLAFRSLPCWTSVIVAGQTTRPATGKTKRVASVRRRFSNHCRPDTEQPPPRISEWSVSRRIWSMLRFPQPERGPGKGRNGPQLAWHRMVEQVPRRADFNLKTMKLNLAALAWQEPARLPVGTRLPPDGVHGDVTGIGCCLGERTSEPLGGGLAPACSCAQLGDRGGTPACLRCLPRGVLTPSSA